MKNSYLKAFLAMALSLPLFLGGCPQIPVDDPPASGDSTRQDSPPPVAGDDSSAQDATPDDPDPAPIDTDGDGLTDVREAEIGTDPALPDSDGDGLNDLFEVELGTDPLEGDSDGDTLSDGDEVAAGLDALSPDLVAKVSKLYCESAITTSGAVEATWFTSAGGLLFIYDFEEWQAGDPVIVDYTQEGDNTIARLNNIALSQTAVARNFGSRVGGGTITEIVISWSVFDDSWIKLGSVLWQLNSYATDDVLLWELGESVIVTHRDPLDSDDRDLWQAINVDRCEEALLWVSP